VPNTDKQCELYPIYGVGPHVHEGLTSDPMSMIGSTRFLPREEWPDNFVEDSDPKWAGIGTWYCPHSCDCSECPDGMVLGEDGQYWIPENPPPIVINMPDEYYNEGEDEGPMPEDFADITDGAGTLQVVEI
jgi:hypothetical protein